MIDHGHDEAGFNFILLIARQMQYCLDGCKTPYGSLTGLLAAAFLAVTLLTGCATNPVTGKSDFVLMSEDQEIALGRQYNAEMLARNPELDDPELSAYVQRVGEQLAQNSHRPELIYRFTVMDTVDVNAFALPGGYIYITRGLLVYLNSEAELAAVLGHEIGHVTARHSVRQYSAATATGVLGAVIAAAAGVQGAGDLTNILGTAIVRGYGREHELEADRLGAQYLARSNYDPQAMINVIEVLKDQEEFDRQLAEEEGREPRAYHALFATHPTNDKRLQEVVAAARQLQKSSQPRVNRNAFLKRLEGVPFGNGEADGILRENRFYHKELDIALEFPVGWRLENLPDRLVAIAPGNGGMLTVTMQDLNRRIPPQEFLTKRLELKDLRNGEDISGSGLVGYTAIADIRTGYGRRLARYVVLYHENRALIFMGVAKNARDPFRYDKEFLSTARSFHTLTPAERELARAKRLHLIRATTATRFRNLARQSPISDHPEEQLRLLNGLYPDGEPIAGRQIKVVR